MSRFAFAPGRMLLSAALVATLAVGSTSVARADDWARDEAATRAVVSLDPAIRTAIEARGLDGAPPVPVVLAPVAAEGFAWGAAALGLGIGVVAMCALFGCVTLVRHDGRLRNA